MPVWDETSSGFTHQVSDPREQMVIDETFSVSAGDDVEISNKIIWVRPTKRSDIEIYGTLVLENCLLLWAQTEHQQTRLRIKDGATLHIKDGYVFSNNPFWVNWEYESGSSIRLDRFVGDPWTSVGGSVDYTSTNFSTRRSTIYDWRCIASVA